MEANKRLKLLENEKNPKAFAIPILTTTARKGIANALRFILFSNNI